MKTFIAALLLASHPAYASHPAIWNCGPHTWISSDKNQISVTTSYVDGTKSPTHEHYNLRWGTGKNTFRVWLNGKECKYLERPPEEE